MFTGIIKEIGQIESIITNQGNKFFKIKSSPLFTDLEIGASVAIDGVCTTIIKKDESSFTIEAMPETLKRTIFNLYKEGDNVNLEPSLKANQDISGHFMQGHVDEMAEVLNVRGDDSNKDIEFFMPETIAKYIAFKGTITVNGVSLTVSKLEDSSFEISLIPHTLKETNLGKINKGDKVNLEIDMMARYLERLLDAKEGHTNYSYLVERGFI